MGKEHRRDLIDRLRRLAMNLRWTWNPEAQQLFASLDPRLWDATHHNPIKLLKLLSPECVEMAQTDPGVRHSVEKM